jgi:hypothetical protein
MLNQLIDKINDAKRALDSRSEDDCTGAGRLEKFWNLLSKGFNSDCGQFRKVCTRIELCWRASETN